MSNIRAITGSTRIMNRNSGGGSKLQGIPSSTNLNTTAHVAFRNRNVVCPCKREYIFCMNQLGGVGAGGIPGRSYAFAPGADGTHRPFYCGHPFGFKHKNNKHIIYPKNNIIHYPTEFTLRNFNDYGRTYLIIDYPLQKNTKYRLSFNIDSFLIFYVLEKNIDNSTTIFLQKIDNSTTIILQKISDSIGAHLPYTFTKNVNLSVLPSQ